MVNPGTVDRVLEPDEDEIDDDAEGHADARPIDKFRDSAVGSVFAAGLLGLRDVIEPTKQEEPAVVVDWSGDPPFSDPLVLRLDPDHPEDSIVMIRPWLRGDDRVELPTGDETFPGHAETFDDVEPNVDPEAGPRRDS
jgi:hypothetical protein